MSILYKVSFGCNMGLVRAVDADDAEEYMTRRIGTDNGPIDIDAADEDDESWFKGMGGNDIATTPAARREDREDGKA